MSLNVLTAEDWQIIANWDKEGIDVLTLDRIENNFKGYSESLTDLQEQLNQNTGEKN